MKTTPSLWAMLFLFCVWTAQAQSDHANTLTYRVEAFGSAASGDNTPFWQVSNRYGKVPLEAGNGYLDAAVFYDGRLGGGFYWKAGLDAVVSAPRYKNVYIQQAYAEIGYRALLLSIGSKERYTSLWDSRLSSGDLVLSPNARPIPEINISLPSYTNVPLTNGWLHVKGDFAAGRSFDSGYLDDFVHEKQVYNKNTLWHHKSFYLKLEDSEKRFPFTFEAGLQHWAQWGGTSTNPRVGKQPQSVKDFLRVIVGKAGGAGSTASDSINVLGNHYGSYDFRLGFNREDWSVHAYYQHFFEDKSGMEFANKTDGLWGVQADLKSFPWIRKVVVEYINTRNQSGPFHFINFDHDKYSARGGGSDSYYNNGEYVTGVSYFNRGIGSPLVPSPEYNTDGSLGFKNNRIRDWHFALEGDLSPQVSYRAMLTFMETWGTHARPLLNQKNGKSGMLEVSYRHPRLAGWLFTGTASADTGSLFGKSAGFGFTVSKTGWLTF